MYSFLVCARKDQQSIEGLLNKSARITRSIMPSLDQNILSSHRMIPEINAGWFILYPDSITYQHLVTDFVDQDTAVIAFGDVIAPDVDSTARYISDIWKQWGVDGVRNLDGCFSAVIVDRIQHTLYVASDLMGRRTLRYFSNDGTLLISPHDVPIMATGMCPLEYDLDSAASIIACNWSLQGKPLLKSVAVCDPNEYVTWHHGKLGRVRQPLITVDERIASNDKIGVTKQIDLIIEKLRDSARILCAGETEIGAGLTAGLDSRTSLALLLSVVDPSCIRANTSGSTSNFEVKTAKKLAAWYGFKHEFKMPDEKDASFFIPHSRLLAFVTNGDTNSKRAIHPLPQIQDKPLVRFHGSGGEVYRGYYLAAPLTDKILENFTRTGVHVVLEGKFRGLGNLPWADPAIADNVRARLMTIIESLGTISSDPLDILDLFYLFERYGRWASMVPRATWARGRYSLFDCPSAVKAAYKLPAPISNNCLLHRTIIKRYTPRAYYWFVNRESLLPLMSCPPAYSMLTTFLRYRNKAFDRVRRTFRLSKHVQSSEQKWSEISASLLGPVFTDVLLNRDSISSCILSRKGLKQILDEHISKRKNHLQMLGFLMTIEQWRILMEETARAAQEDT